MSSKEKLTVVAALLVGIVIVLWPVLAIATGLFSITVAFASQLAAIVALALLAWAIRNHRASGPE